LKNLKGWKDSFAVWKNGELQYWTENKGSIKTMAYPAG
jgi:hypothetical protein